MAGGWKTCHVPRRTWLDSKIDVFLGELAESGMHLDRQRAGELITGQVRAVAALMSITEATARTYLGDEIIKDMPGPRARASSSRSQVIARAVHTTCAED